MVQLDDEEIPKLTWIDWRGSLCATRKRERRLDWVLSSSCETKLYKRLGMQQEYRFSYKRRSDTFEWLSSQHWLLGTRRAKTWIWGNKKVNRETGRKAGSSLWCRKVVFTWKALQAIIVSGMFTKIVYTRMYLLQRRDHDNGSFNVFRRLRASQEMNYISYSCFVLTLLANNEGVILPG